MGSDGCPPLGGAPSLQPQPASSSPPALGAEPPEELPPLAALPPAPALPPFAPPPPAPALPPLASASAYTPQGIKSSGVSRSVSASTYAPAPNPTIGTSPR